MTMLSPEGRVILISGANRGIGLATTEILVVLKYGKIEQNRHISAVTENKSIFHHLVL